LIPGPYEVSVFIPQQNKNKNLSVISFYGAQVGFFRRDFEKWLLKKPALDI
jgi:hypothetical protein